jgi:high-affinity Fe2+/Pb2+ permease
MKTLWLKIGISFGLILSSIPVLALAKQYWREYIIYETNGSLDNHILSLMVATALITSGVWVFVIALITERD